MYLQDSETFPLLMRTIHQAEDLCEAASHAAYYMRNNSLDFELCGVESGTSQAGYHIRQAGKMLEEGYNESDWFEISDEPSSVPASMELYQCLMKDLKRTVQKIRKAISYLADWQDCKDEIKELRKAQVCILGAYYPMLQSAGFFQLEIEIAARNKAKSRSQRQSKKVGG